MTFQELQTQVLQLSLDHRWQLVQLLLESLKQETRSPLKQSSLSRLRGIAKSSESNTIDDSSDYVNYLTQKYQ